MRLQTCGLDTDAALVAMTVFGRATDATDPTGVAMILSLIFVVEEDADGAPVGTQSRGTRLTGLAGRLYSLTELTLDRRNGMSIEGMSLFMVAFALVFDGVVAESAGEEFVTAGCQKDGLALVMGTTIVCCCLF